MIILVESPLQAKNWIKSRNNLGILRLFIEYKAIGLDSALQSCVPLTSCIYLVFRFHRMERRGTPCLGLKSAELGSSAIHVCIYEKGIFGYL